MDAVSSQAARRQLIVRAWTFLRQQTASPVESLTRAPAGWIDIRRERGREGVGVGRLRQRDDRLVPLFERAAALDPFRQVVQLLPPPAEFGSRFGQIVLQRFQPRHLLPRDGAHVLRLASHCPQLQPQVGLAGVQPGDRLVALVEPVMQGADLLIQLGDDRPRQVELGQGLPLLGAGRLDLLRQPHRLVPPMGHLLLHLHHLLLDPLQRGAGFVGRGLGSVEHVAELVGAPLALLFERRHVIVRHLQVGRHLVDALLGRRQRPAKLVGRSLGGGPLGRQPPLAALQLLDPRLGLRQAAGPGFGQGALRLAQPGRLLQALPQRLQLALRP